jgi:general stress protein CsbA
MSYGIKGYNENIVLIGASVFTTVVGFVIVIAADNMQPNYCAK